MKSNSRSSPLRLAVLHRTNGTTVDLIDGELSWRMGRGAQENRLYMSTDANLVADANDSVLIDTLSESRYPVANTGAQYAETYYWQIVEVADDQVTPGPVWNFNTPDYLVIDDMESYDMSNLIYETWLDGYDVDENGSEIGDGEPYVEQEIAFGGSQSMPMYYDTTDGEEAAWVELAVDSEIFNTGGVTQFSVMFKSDRTNDGGDFYVEINGTRVYSPASPDDRSVDSVDRGPERIRQPQQCRLPDPGCRWPKPGRDRLHR